jgi:alpha-galactosidase
MVLEDPAARECLYIGIEWEREWEMVLAPSANGIDLSFHLDSYENDLLPGGFVQSPAIFIGLSHGDLDDASNKMKDYLCRHVFPSVLVNFPWISYDIWSTDREDVEKILCEEMDFAVDLGVDLFYIDASWWTGSSIRGKGAWGLGLGCYNEDRRKFPSGLRKMSDRAHQHGLKFGLWVDPMIIDTAHVANGLVPSDWLVQENGVDSELRIGQEDWPPVKQLCTGCPGVQDYLIDKLTALVEKYNLDWLKWDDSALATPFCNRTDHGHGKANGNYEAVRGKYAVCAALIRKYPDLVIEQCGYPARLDYGLAQFVRANWLSDASTPSVHVRNNMEIACYIYPASYNAAWILRDDETLSESDPIVIDSIVRSRMMGLFGMGTLTGKLSERISLLPQTIQDGIRRNIPHYKSFRHLLAQHAWHLSPQKREADQWQAMEFSAWDGNEAVTLIFRGSSPIGANRICLRGLIDEAEYQVSLNDAAIKLIASGKVLMDQGLTVNLNKKEASEIIRIRRV